MPERKSPTSHDSAGYDVGYRKPPVHSRFPAGKSGYPAGRKKGVRNLKTDVVRTLAAPVKVNEGGRTRIRSTQEGALMVLREKALRGDARALDRLFELSMRFNNDWAEISQGRPLPADDQAILTAYIAEITTASMSPTPGNVALDGQAGSRPASDKKTPP